MSTETYNQASVVSCKGAKSENWYAWLDEMPPPPDALHVIGEVLVGNPGIRAMLTKRVPQGTNPNILQLVLHLVQEPGQWPQVELMVPARYDESPAQHKYTDVEIFCDADVIANVKVQQVS